MSNQSNVEKGFGTAWPFVLPNVAETFQFQMRAWLQEQAELLDETQQIMAGIAHLTSSACNRLSRRPPLPPGWPCSMCRPGCTRS
jgi:hypothetical protein